MNRILDRFRVDDERRVRPSRTLSITKDLQGSEPKLGLYRDCRRTSATIVPTAAISTMLGEANRLAVEAYRQFAAHAGVVSKDGLAIAFPAESGGGKSTLTGACVLAGFDYVSDEALCVHLDTAEVRPYPKQLGLSAASRQLLGLRFTSALWEEAIEAAINVEELGGVPAVGPLTLSDVVLAEYGHSEQTLEPVPASEVMTTLLRMSFNSYKHPEASFRLTARLAGEVQGWRLRYGDPLRAAALLGERLSR